MNHGLFFQEKESSELYRSQLLEINSLMVESIRNQFSKTKFLYKLLNLIIIYSFSKIGNGQVVVNILLENMVHEIIFHEKTLQQKNDIVN